MAATARGRAAAAAGQARGPGSDAAIVTRMATQTTSESGGTHRRKAAGTGNGSHGGSSNARSARGRIDALARLKPTTAPPAAAAMTNADSDTGRTAILAPLAPAKPMV